MTKTITPQEMDLLSSLMRKAKDSGVDVYALEDFSSTPEYVIRDQLAALDEPVFTNPTTGQAASSVHAVLLALDYPRRR